MLDSVPGVFVPYAIMSPLRGRWHHLPFADEGIVVQGSLASGTISPLLFLFQYPFASWKICAI